MIPASPNPLGAPSGPAAAQDAPRWGTVTLAHEPSELLFAFAAYHARLGASEINIFLDRPNPRLGRLLRDVPGVLTYQCDDAFWAEHGPRSRLQTKRQAIVANLAYQTSELDWIAHVDADEFIAPQAGAQMGEELAALPEQIVALRLPVMERVWRAETPPVAIFDGLFRKKLPGLTHVQEHLHGDLASYMHRGLTGHVAGKTFSRVGAGLTLGIHTPLHHEILPVMASQTMDLLHFDGLTPLHWILKRLSYGALPHAEKRIDGDSYKWRQVAELMRRSTEPEARAFQERLTTVDAATEAQFRTLALLAERPGFDPAADLAALLPERRFDLTTAQFDKRIRARDADLLKHWANAHQNTAPDA